MLQKILHVALGGALGSVLRYLTGVGAIWLVGPGFPWATLTVNIVGSFVMGMVVELLGQRGGMYYAPLLMTGLLGGFTTFSAFSLDAMTLWERGDPLVAFGYVAGTILLSFAAIFLAMHLFRGAFA